MNIKDYLRVIRRNWYSFLLLPLLGVLAATFASLLQTPQWESSAKVFVSAGQVSSAQDLNQGSDFGQQAVKSYADVVDTPIVLNSVIRDLSLGVTASELAEHVVATAPADTAVLEIAVTDPSRVRAARIANSISARLVEVVPSLSPATSDNSSAVKITPIQAAEPGTEPVSPRIVLNIVQGLIAGLILAVIAGVIREAIDTRIYGVRDVESVTDRPVLGGISFDADARQRPLIVQVEPSSPRAESFRSLRTNLQFLALDDAHRSFVVTSSVESEGKSTSVANLAIAMADAGESVVVVDADLRRPKLASYLNVDGGVGLTDVLIGTADLDVALQKWGSTGLAVLPSGAIPPNPNELLQSNAMTDLIERLQERYSTVLFDAPPLLPVSDAAILARRVSGALVVCAARRTGKHQLRAALSVLSGVEAGVLGVVLTMLPQRGSDAYRYNNYGYR